MDLHLLPSFAFDLGEICYVVGATMSFKLGDRVVAYFACGAELVRDQGTVTVIHDTGALAITLDGDEGYPIRKLLAHPRQCRRLVKKKKGYDKTIVWNISKLWRRP